MIMVDVIVPALNKSYDFKLDDEVCMSVLKEEVAQTICQKERWPAPKSVQSLLIGCLQTEQLLSNEDTLSAAGIGTGMSLILL